jgi:hypothetical protein
VSDTYPVEECGESRDSIIGSQTCFDDWIHDPHLVETMPIDLNNDYGNRLSVSPNGRYFAVLHGGAMITTGNIDMQITIWAFSGLPPSLAHYLHAPTRTVSQFGVSYEDLIWSEDSRYLYAFAREYFIVDRYNVETGTWSDAYNMYYDFTYYRLVPQMPIMKVAGSEEEAASLTEEDAYRWDYAGWEQAAISGYPKCDTITTDWVLCTYRVNSRDNEYRHVVVQFYLPDGRGEMAPRYMDTGSDKGDIAGDTFVVFFCELCMHSIMPWTAWEQSQLEQGKFYPCKGGTQSCYDSWRVRYSVGNMLIEWDMHIDRTYLTTMIIDESGVQSPQSSKRYYEAVKVVDQELEVAGETVLQWRKIRKSPKYIAPHGGTETFSAGAHTEVVYFPEWESPIGVLMYDNVVGWFQMVLNTKSRWMTADASIMGPTADAGSPAIYDYSFFPNGQMLFLGRNNIYRLQVCKIPLIDCGVGQFSDDGFHCQSWADVPWGKYITVLGDDLNDHQFADCTVCGTGQYISQECRGRTASFSLQEDTHCAACLDCLGGEYFTDGICDGTGIIAQRACTKCTDCPSDNFITGYSGIDKCDGKGPDNAAPFCTSCDLECTDAEYLFPGCSGATFSNDRYCRTGTWCPSGYYRVFTEYNAESSCVDVSNPGIGQYTETMATWNSDAVFTDCTVVCGTGQYISQGCRGSEWPSYQQEDTVCAPCLNCPWGYYLKDGICDGTGTIEQRECSKCNDCEPGYFITGYSYDGIDRCDGNGHLNSLPFCQECNSVCEDGQYIADFCDGRGFLNDNLCGDCVNCLVGQYRTNGACDGTGTIRIGECASCVGSPCTTNYYIGDSNLDQCDGNGDYNPAPTCVLCEPCGPGLYMRHPCNGVSTADYHLCASCDVCADGYYAVCDAGYAASCVAYSINDSPGIFLSNPGTWNSDNGFADCYTVCSPGWYIAQYCRGGDWAEDQQQNIQCNSCISCPFGYVTELCDGSDISVNTCVKCPGCPTGYHFSSNQPANWCDFSNYDPTVQAVCQECEITCSSNEYIKGNCTGHTETNVLSCEPCDVCGTEGFSRCDGTTSDGACRLFQLGKYHPSLGFRV